MELSIREVFNIGVEDLPDFIGENGHFSTIFDFSAHMLSDGEHGWYDAPPISFDAWKKAITDSQMRVQNVGFEANIIENHDEPRGVSRFLPDYAQNADGAKDAWYSKCSAAWNSVYLSGAGDWHAECQMEQCG